MARNFLKAEIKKQFQNWTASYGPIFLKAQGPSKKKGNGETGLPTMEKATRNHERLLWRKKTKSQEKNKFENLNLDQTFLKTQKGNSKT